ncbi:MAG: hypothetical protein GY716_11200 [bacterium]|nr:hypothetical protein [bacterium]
MSSDAQHESLAEIRAALPLLSATPAAWAGLATDRLPEFLADHAVCEQQAALYALNLVAHYPDDQELVERMSSLAIEEVVHMRRVAVLLHRRGWRVGRRRSNAYVNALRRNAQTDREPALKVDRLLIGALIEARSCERFSCLLDGLGDRDPEVAALLADLGPAEKRHWEMFFALARREAEPDWLEGRWKAWLQYESDAIGSGESPSVHG